MKRLVICFLALGAIVGSSGCGSLKIEPPNADICVADVARLRKACYNTILDYNKDGTIKCKVDQSTGKCLMKNGKPVRVPTRDTYYNSKEEMLDAMNTFIVVDQTSAGELLGFIAAVREALGI